MITMARYANKFFDLAIVDPPYGIGENAYRSKSRTKLAKTTDWGAFDKTWDKECPKEEYFTELFRVSKNQIIFGANNMMHLIKKASTCWIVWNKDNTGCFADCELAYTSFETAVRLFTFRWNGMLQQNMANKDHRIHPTQKPVELYKWLLHNYAKPGQSILDTHMGSQSSRIAAYKLNFDYYGSEIDQEYFYKGNNRFNFMLAQKDIFLQQDPDLYTTTPDYE